MLEAIMEQEANPYTPPKDLGSGLPTVQIAKKHRGPLMYFALAGIAAAILAVPLIVPRSLAVKDNPNPIGYLLVLFSMPVGGLVYRLRSRRWPIDRSARKRQVFACFLTLLLPLTFRLLTGLRGQGMHMTILSGIVSLTLMAGILVSGLRRGRNVA